MNHKQLSLIASSVLLALSPSLHAQGTEQQADEKIVVTASRLEVTQQEKTRSIDVVDQKKLAEIQPNSVAEALKFEPNVSLAGGNVPGNQSVNIRGLQGNKILQVIDGNRQNFDYDHRPSYFLDPSLLSDVQVIKGPISSLYGSGAIGGVVIQNTINAADIVDGKGLGGRIKTGYQDNGDVWTNTAAIANQSDNIDWLLAGSVRDTGVMEQGNGYKLYGTESTDTTGLAKLNWQANSANRFGLSLRYSDRDGHPPVVGSTDPAATDTLIDRNTEDQSVILSYNFNPANELVNLDTRIYYNQTEILETATTGNGKDLSKIKTTGFSITNESELGALQVYTGLDGYQDKLNAKRGNGEQGRPTPPDGAETTTLGAFAYVNYALTDTIGLDAGLRYDTFKAEAKGQQDNDESAVSPSAGISWQAASWMQWSLRYDEAFRAPTTTELYMDGTHFTMFSIPGIGPVTNAFTPNPDLKPEKAQSIELKGQFDFENLIAKDKLSLTAAVFRNEVEDFINLDVFVPTDSSAMMGCIMGSGSGIGCAGTSRSVNVDRAELEGYEVAAVYRVASLSAGLSYGQTRGKDKSDGSWLDNVPADKWVAQLEYALWQIDTNVGTRALFASEQDRVSGNETYDSYNTVDFYATWEPLSNLDGLKVDFTVANAFDENYRVAWNEVYQPGRSFRLSAQYTF
ncbi:TonB-dependent hemoglobin/transferrin/lactoferrin family receptor [Photobacterium sp. WH77]|uniref:TonB-dependent hemoglobin/transferrin/lactoferrin family receptor n=1 Tax=unclassified Photobacterium TaxID=2628852 RepID=UPI001EDC88D7|nr:MULTISPECIES: TonB-dependent hemoglobin/transferrin/lactoferrin family receptor [unclassified Photobacterium]MCG2836320.1 TonB-dependent hemoglobin/transferrin/lactoferrin family receptor [Photobacterium sp. WH77]MCG2844053.1 TonB-dependent hemoglobin/transferrin/lactoferrin family receptor [Photobacterium sp. WH80]